MNIPVEFEGKWVDPAYLEAALEDIVDMLGEAAKRTGGAAQAYTWLFQSPRGRYITLEITARRTA